MISITIISNFKLTQLKWSCVIIFFYDKKRRRGLLHNQWIESDPN